jgi:quercetin dioxygenase-like cupin family protein
MRIIRRHAKALLGATALAFMPPLTAVLAQPAQTPAAQAPAAAAAPARGGRGGGRGGPAETWYINKVDKVVYTPPNRPIWRQADLLKMHAGQNNWVQQVVLDNEQDATYNSAAPGSKLSPRIHPDTDTVFVVFKGQIRFTVEGQEPVIATRTSMINIMKNTEYSYEVLPGENALFVEDNVRGYSSLYPVDGPVPAPAKGDEMVKVSFPRGPAPYTGVNRLAFNTLDAIATCKLGPAIEDDRLYLTPNTSYLNPADNKCAAADGGGGRRGGRRGGGAGGEGGAAGPIDVNKQFGHLHSGAVEWWIVQLGGIVGNFEQQGTFHAVEGDILYAAPATWHQMGADAPSGPSVRVTMGSYQRLNMNSIPPEK